MIHKVSDLCDKITVIYEKSMNLRRMKYDTPKEKQEHEMIQYLIDDIQHLCRMIGADTDKYQK